MNSNQAEIQFAAATKPTGETIWHNTFNVNAQYKNGKRYKKKICLKSFNI
jgi:hypothetical protein